MDLRLARDPAESYCTLGGLFVVDLKLHTLELPWRQIDSSPGGEPGKSCVPPGTYDLVLHDSVDHPRTWALVNHALGVYHDPADVPAGISARTDVLLHTGNDCRDTLGCILVGRSRMISGGEWIITGSRLAFGDLRAVLPWTAGHTLTIEAAQ